MHLLFVLQILHHLLQYLILHLEIHLLVQEDLHLQIHLENMLLETLKKKLKIIQFLRVQVLYHH